MMLEPADKSCDKLIVDKAPARERFTILFDKQPSSIMPNADGKTHTIICTKDDTITIYPKARIELEPDDEEKYVYVNKISANEKRKEVFEYAKKCIETLADTTDREAEEMISWLKHYLD